ncbi:MAG TPA: GNAT family N-acetyltransferase, partial [Polyangiaceae bacterium]|nr:GNAT family N-acetyltransferase [Polyangiaceae bacterium]
MAYATLAFDLGAHRDALSRLWADNMSDPAVAAIVPERVRWLYERNPEGPPTTVLIDDGGPDGLVGCASVMPRRAWAGGREVRAGVLCDLAVARRHRVGGPALMLQRSLIEAIKTEGYAFLWGYPNRNSVPVFKRLGYKPVAEALSWVRPLRTGEFLRRFAPPPAANAGGALLDAALSLAERGAAAAFAAGREGAHEDHFDARFDELWARARGHYEVTGARDAAFLRWRYEEFPSGRHLVFGLSEGATLVGYVIYRVVSGGGVHVADLFCDEPERHFDALLLHFVRAMRAAGHASVVIALIAGEAVGARLRRHGFVRRNDPRPLVVRPLEGEGLETVVDPRRWYIIDGDLDILTLPPRTRARARRRGGRPRAGGEGGRTRPLSFATSLLPGARRRPVPPEATLRPARRLRVCFVVNNLDVGGLEKVALSLI